MVAGRDVHPVKEPAMLLVSLGCEKFEGRANSLLCLVARDPAVFSANADCGEPKAGGRKTGNVAARPVGAPSVGVSAVEHQTRGGVALYPKIEHAAAFQVLEKGAILRRDDARRFGVGDCGG